MTLDELKQAVLDYTSKHGKHPTVLVVKPNVLVEFLNDVPEDYYSVLQTRIDSRANKDWELSDTFYSW